MNQNVPCLTIMHENGYDFDAPNPSGNSLAVLAAIHHSPTHGDAVFQFLLDRGIRLGTPDAHGKLPSVEAARHGNLDALRFLQEHGVNLSTADGEGRLVSVAAMRTVITFPVDTLRFLSDNGVDIFGEDRSGLTPLTAGLHNNVHIADIINFFVERGVNLNEQMPSGHTLATYLASSNIPWSRKKALFLDFHNRGINLSTPDRDGVTPLAHLNQILERTPAIEVEIARALAVRGLPFEGSMMPYIRENITELERLIAIQQEHARVA